MSLDPMNVNSQVNQDALLNVRKYFSNCGEGQRVIQNIAAVLTHGTEFQMPRRIRGLMCPKIYMVGTLAGVAQKNNEDLAELIKRHVANSQEVTPWAGPGLAIAASDPPMWADLMISNINSPLLWLDDIVLIEGNFYKVTKVPHNRDQISFKPVLVTEAIELLN